MATDASSSAAILSTMQYVTTNKWDKAEARLAEIKGHVHDVETKLAYKPGSQESDELEIEADVVILLKAVRKVWAGANIKGGKTKYGVAPESLGIRCDTIERMLFNAKYSSGISTSAALSWRQELLDYLRQVQRRMEYTILFGKLTKEWADFRSSELEGSIASAKQNTSQSNTVSEDEGSASVGRKEMHEQREIWEGLVTNLRTSDREKAVEFLDDLFQSSLQHEKERGSGDESADLRPVLLSKMRNSIFNNTKGPISVTVAIVKAAIEVILVSDQLTSKKRRAMIDLSNREDVLQEVVDILNIDLKLSALARWSWGDTPIKAQMRKTINGKYRVYMDFELVDSILIQCVGQFVSAEISTALKQAWLPEFVTLWEPEGASNTTVATDDSDISAFLSRMNIPAFPSQKKPISTIELRTDMYRNRFLASRLPEGMLDESGGFGWYDQEDADSGKALAGLTDLAKRSNDVLSLKTDILRICSAEMSVQRIVHGQFCLLQSDFEWFGPSLPHSTLTLILDYFCFPEQIVQFLKAFLDVNLQFKEDGPDGAVLNRKTGIPVSFQLADGVSELLLFILDFAVNQRTGGAHLYRNHDDLWFWGQPSQCAAAWETIRQFSEVMGLRLNMKKTAFAHAVDESNPRYKPPVAGLDLPGVPAGKVKWGFLQFDEKNWKWTADKTAIEEHMDELRFQLKSRTSVMSHVQAYNAYMRDFLPRNFGPVTLGLGDDHPVMVLEALQHAQQYLYRSESGEDLSENVANYVRETIQERFGGDVHEQIPDCFLYLGIEDGGLGLANPAPAFAQHIQLPNYDLGDGRRDPLPLEHALERLNSDALEQYLAERKEFVSKHSKKRHGQSMQSRQREDADSGAGGDNGSTDPARQVDAAPKFMSFSAYMGMAEKHSRNMSLFYSDLLAEPNTQRLRSNKEWAAKMFDGELRDLFGGYMAEDEFLSLGLYRTLAEEKVRWSG
ncbi:hypothetical protein LLEC1_01219 [Akanthomyces lecanii]|uniref:Reverse transcriptase domain-containing protein n=1 Tax=Cordyceps confragosa TaxID=2714763 RepID=A0A179I8Z7_CORDF|nr:hypothetical protein LLEC1_01219 [Akanthomyces lecanii]